MKVETTMQRQAVMEYLAKESILDVIYEEEKLDEKLLEQLAEDTLKREQELTGATAAATAPAVVDAVVEEPAVVATPEPVVVEEEKAPEPVAVAEATTTTTTEVIPIDENMSLEEKAFAALFNAGAVRINKAPDDPDYDSSQDDLEAPENIYVQKE
jgi:hypothetical protein